MENRNRAWTRCIHGNYEPECQDCARPKSQGGVMEVGDMVSALCAMMERTNTEILKNHKGPSLPDGGWKILERGLITSVIVMARDDGSQFRITVEKVR